MNYALSKLGIHKFSLVSHASNLPEIRDNPVIQPFKNHDVRPVVFDDIEHRVFVPYMGLCPYPRV